MEKKIGTATIPLEDYMELIRFKENMMNADKIIFYHSHSKSWGEVTLDFISNDDALKKANELNHVIVAENDRIKAINKKLSAENEELRKSINIYEEKLRENKIIGRNLWKRKQ